MAKKWVTGNIWYKNYLTLIYFKSFHSRYIGNGKEQLPNFWTQKTVFIHITAQWNNLWLYYTENMLLEAKNGSILNMKILESNRNYTERN